MVNKDFMQNAFFFFFKHIYFHGQKQTQYFEDTSATSLFCSVCSAFAVFLSDLLKQTSREADGGACGLGGQ